MDLHLESIDKDLAFNVKIQISLIKNAERIMDLYPEKKSKFVEYIEERKEKIREMLNIKKARIMEYDKFLLEI
ncbi:MAG: hypothetical protein ACP5F1_01655 [Thermoplasmata archaeon]|nr:hypothetical protein [Thermoplasmata archaeon]